MQNVYNLSLNYYFQISSSAQKNETDSLWAQAWVTLFVHPNVTNDVHGSQIKKPHTTKCACANMLTDGLIIKPYWEPPFGHSFDSVIVPTRTHLHQPFFTRLNKTMF